MCAKMILHNDYDAIGKAKRPFFVLAIIPLVTRKCGTQGPMEW